MINNSCDPSRHYYYFLQVLLSVKVNGTLFKLLT